MTLMPLTQLSVRTLHVLIALCYLISVCQCFHAYHSYVRKVRRVPEHEVALVLHLLCLTLVYVAACQNWQPSPTVDFYPLHLDASGLLWFGAVAICLDVVLVARRRIPYLVVDAAAMALTLPPVLGASPQRVVPLLLEATAYFLLRTVVMIALDHRDGLSVVSSISVAEALRSLPTGVLYASAEGDALFENDAMRAVLNDLGIPSDLADLSDLLSTVPGTRMDDGSLLVELPSGRSRLLVRDEVTYRGRPRTRYLAYDVTDLVALEREVARTNDELAQTREELLDALSRVRAYAEGEALLNMQARVHDVVGQRLSILHRALEDGNVSDEAIAALVPLITGATEELIDTEGDASSRLAPVVHAFGLAGITIDVQGNLPQDVDTAQAFADIVREAATNAVRHAHATCVTVRLWSTDDAEHLEVTDDGTPPDAPLVVGKGMPGMQRAAEALGGTFDFYAGQPFTIRVQIPKRLAEGGA